MRFAKWMFLLAGVSGILLVVPPYFLERQTGEDYPPSITHPEYYYGFFGVTLAWQVMFLVIATDPVRYRRAMLRGLLLRRPGQGLQSSRSLQRQPARRSDGHG
jgi:hypothetical protein